MPNVESHGPGEQERPDASATTDYAAMLNKAKESSSDDVDAGRLPNTDETHELANEFHAAVDPKLATAERAERIRDQLNSDFDAGYGSPFTVLKADHFDKVAAGQRNEVTDILAADQPPAPKKTFWQKLTRR